MRETVHTDNFWAKSPQIIAGFTGWQQYAIGNIVDKQGVLEEGAAQTPSNRLDHFYACLLLEIAACMP